MDLLAGDHDMLLENFLSQAFSTNGYIPSPPAGFINHGQCCHVVTSHIHDDFCGDGLMYQKSKVPCCLERGAQSIRLCLS